MNPVISPFYRITANYFLLVIRHFQVLFQIHLPLEELNLNIKDFEVQSVQRGSFTEPVIQSVVSGTTPA